MVRSQRLVSVHVADTVTIKLAGAARRSFQEHKLPVLVAFYAAKLPNAAPASTFVSLAVYVVERQMNVCVSTEVLAFMT